MSLFKKIIIAAVLVLILITTCFYWLLLFRNPRSTFFDRKVYIGKGDTTDMPNSRQLFVVGDFYQGGTNLLGAFRANQIDSASSVQPLEGYAKLSHRSGNVNLAFGVIGNVEMNSPGTITEIRPIQSGGVFKSSGNVDSWKSFLATVSVNKGTGVINNGYGFYMNPWPSGGILVKNKWGVFINDSTAKNYFRGEVSLRHLSGNSNNTSAKTFIPGASVLIKGNDLGGEVCLSVSSSNYFGKLIAVKFATPFSSPPKVMLTCANEKAPILNSSIYVTATDTCFFLQIIHPKTNLSGIYKWNYLVVQ